METTRVWWRLPGRAQPFKHEFSSNATWADVVSYIDNTCYGPANHPGTAAIHVRPPLCPFGRFVDIASLHALLFFFLQLKPFGAQEDEPEVDYTQELSDQAAPATSKEEPRDLEPIKSGGAPRSCCISYLVCGAILILGTVHSLIGLVEMDLVARIECIDVDVAT